MNICYSKDLAVALVVILFQSGKTFIANVLSESINIDEAGTPRSTQGVRVVEFELPLNINDKQYKVDIELWDCSGDHK